MKILTKDGKDTEGKIFLGRLEAGKTKDYEFILHNDSPAEVEDLEVVISHNEVSVLAYPDKLMPQAQGQLKIRWSPTLTLKRGLQTLVKVEGTALYK